MRRLRRAAALVLLAHAGLVGARAARLECDVPCAPGRAANGDAPDTPRHEAVADDVGLPPSLHAHGGLPTPVPHHGHAGNTCDLAAGCVAPFIVRPAGGIALAPARAGAPGRRTVLFPASVSTDPVVPPPRA